MIFMFGQMRRTVSHRDPSVMLMQLHAQTGGDRPELTGRLRVPSLTCF